MRYLFRAKHGVLETAYAAGAYRVLKAVNNLRGKRLTIVTYHRVADGDGIASNRSLDSLFVRAETFEKQILFFKKNYRITGFEGLAGMLGRNDVPSSLLVITFDDAYRDFFRCAHPILRKYEVPATLFVPAGLLGTTRRFPFWWDELYCHLSGLAKREQTGIVDSASGEVRTLVAEFKADKKACFDRILESRSHGEIERILECMRCLPGSDAEGNGEENAVMSWEQVRELSDLVEIGSHTLTHRNLRYSTTDEIENEVAGSKREIEARTGRRVLAFSYPNGYYDERVVAAVRRADYRFAVTTDNGLNVSCGSHLLKRINIWEGSSSVVPGHFSEGKLALRVAGVSIRRRRNGGHVRTSTN